MATSAASGQGGGAGGAPAQGEGQAMWGGRFSAKPADLMQAINVSIGFDTGAQTCGS